MVSRRGNVVFTQNDDDGDTFDHGTEPSSSSSDSKVGAGSVIKIYIRRELIYSELNVDFSVYSKVLDESQIASRETCGVTNLSDMVTLTALQSGVF